MRVLNIILEQDFNNKKLSVPINIKFCMIVQRSWPTSRQGRKLKFGRLAEGPSKPKIKSETWRIFHRGGRNGNEKCNVLQYSGTDFKMSNTVYKGDL
jgi:hypothetical protein